MQEQDDLSPEQREFELALRSIPPAGGRVDATAAAFAAGRRSARREVYLWRSAAAATVLLAIGSFFVPRPAGSPTKPLQVETVLASHPTPFSDQSLLMLQETVQKNGINGLPVTHVPDARPLRPGDNL